MPTTVSSRAFNQDTTRAKKATAQGPVFITDRGRPAHVLLSMEDYERLSGPSISIDQLLAMSEDDTIEFDPSPLSLALTPASFD
ncbi:type II toxin-antitoxin system Phd/YefM family antitoxin [Pseudomonas sp. DC3200b2]|uniref:type II toxin-antitoxin system Phd/YefM family antitoxin n=1 Tax=Pseudomonas sp. DC3200b2 TaxID=2804669 RepID=UPI003CED02E0